MREDLTIEQIVAVVVIVVVVFAFVMNLPT
jgi:hypothetical protein